MNRKILPAILFLVSLGTPLYSASRSLDGCRDAYKKQISAIDSERENTLKRALTKYEKSLDTVIAKAKQKGDLDSVTALREERDRFKEEKTVPSWSPATAPVALTEIQSTYRGLVAKADLRKNKKTLALINRYIASLKALKKQYVIDDKIELALKTRAAIEEVEFDLAEAEASVPATEPESKPLFEPGADKKPSLNLPDGLVLHYSFDKKTGEVVEDESGNDNDGEIHGPALTAEGKSGGGCVFRRGCIVVPHSDSLNTTGGVTLATWVKLQTTKDTPQVVLAKGYSRRGSRRWVYLLEFIADSPRPQFVLPGRRRTYRCAFSRDLSFSEWHHIAATYNGKTEKLYIDGDKVKQRSTTIGLRQSSAPLTIGAYRKGSDTCALTGALDDVMIFNRALSGTEVGQVFKATGGILKSEKKTKAKKKLTLPATRR